MCFEDILLRLFYLFCRKIFALKEQIFSVICLKSEGKIMFQF